MPWPFAQAILQRRSSDLLHSQTSILEGKVIIFLFSVNEFERVLEGHPEKAMAPLSSTLAWKIPWTEEPGRLQSMGSQRVGHD